MHTTTYSGAIVGVDGLVVEVEVDIARGIPCFSIVGLPNTAVRESRERVTAALKNSGWDFPLERITVNLAPADIRKEGSAFDLAIAAGILVASGQAPSAMRERTLFLGELALDGALRRVAGVLPAVLHARRSGFTRAIVPWHNYDETRVAEGVQVIACRRLRDAVAAAFADDRELDDTTGTLRIKPADATPPPPAVDTAHALDMADVAGQESVKRAMLVAAAGGHHVLMVGSPGAGKTMLARRIATILPPLDSRQALETTMIYSIAGLLGDHGRVAARPFRAPHHTASDAGLIGGGASPRPGEVTLSHNGVLFLDELPEFRRHVLETLREPLEDGRITISRARTSVTFPARFQLVAAMNPCPCGYNGSGQRQCRCTDATVEKYLSRVSGPLLDRIAIQVFVNPVDPEDLRSARRGDGSAALRDRAVAAREFARVRAGGNGAAAVDNGGAAAVDNASIPEGALRETCRLTDDAESLLTRAQKQFHVSARGRAHIMRVARTIADLSASFEVTPDHIAEATQYRLKGMRR